MNERNIKIGFILFSLGAFFFLIGNGWSVKKGLSAEIILSEVAYTQSDTCLRCHPAHYESWAQTYHRTMTQLAEEETVLGDFSGVRYRYQGVESRFFMAGDVPMIETANWEGEMSQFPIIMSVGSRRIQQYVTKIGDEFWRLPLAWNVEEGYWFHLNGGFLDPDGSDFQTHLTQWDSNCIFCHNVKAQPGYDPDLDQWNSEVAELGIACESCHGPGEEHIAENQNPMRRYLLYYGQQSDPTIITPHELPAEQQIQLCGHCHGQRIFYPLNKALDYVIEGDPYTAGDDLNQYSRPVWRETSLFGIDFAARFWNDGTPRLTAYEYQGILLSKEHVGTDLTCTSCHSMHGGDPKGMIEPELRGNEGCLQCHEEIELDVAGHTKHEVESSGSDCYACHMPKISYGILQVHPTHRIQNPDPSRAWEYEMPEACTLCHTNESVIWAAEAWSEQYGKAVELPVGEEYRVAENIRALLSGDVVQRSVAVMALSDERSYLSRPQDRLWVVPYLLLLLEDEYPAVRHFAYRGLVHLAERLEVVDREMAGGSLEIGRFDPLAELEERQVVVAAWQAWWDGVDKKQIAYPGEAVLLDEQFELDWERVNELIGLREEVLISIGE